MKPCGPCPTLGGIKYGFDPEAYDLLNDPRSLAQREAQHLYCPWERRSCPTHQRVCRIAVRCHQAQRPIPYKLHPEFLT